MDLLPIYEYSCGTYSFFDLCLSCCLCFYCIDILYKHAAALFQLYACQHKMKLWGKEVPIKLVLQISPIKQTTHKFYCLA